jgi:hypothetical protein
MCQARPESCWGKSKQPLVERGGMQDGRKTFGLSVMYLSHWIINTAHPKVRPLAALNAR